MLQICTTRDNGGRRMNVSKEPDTLYQGDFDGLYQTGSLVMGRVEIRSQVLIMRNF